MNLDFNGATGSEKLIFYTDDGHQSFTAQLAGSADSSLGLIDFKDSTDYLFDNNLATESQSLNRDTTMSFEFHLSPERGLTATTVPEPGAALLISLSGVMLLLRRHRSE